MITRREALWGAIRALGGAAIVLLAPFTLKAHGLTHTYKGITMRFTHEVQSQGSVLVGRFYGREGEYASGVLDSSPTAKSGNALKCLLVTGKRTIDMHLRETGYVP